VAAEILAEAAATDAAEHAADSGDDGDVPSGLRDRRGRRQRLRALLDELEAEATEKSYEAHMARRAEKEAATGKPIRGRRPTPGSATHKPRRQANLTDPDSRLLKTKDGYLQGYNAQAVATTDQYVIAPAFRMSLASRSSAFSFFSRLISASSSLVGPDRWPESV
jgi:hypothetical protein